MNFLNQPLFELVRPSGEKASVATHSPLEAVFWMELGYTIEQYMCNDSGTMMAYKGTWAPLRG